MSIPAALNDMEIPRAQKVKLDSRQRSSVSILAMEPIDAADNKPEEYVKAISTPQLASLATGTVGPSALMNESTLPSAESPSEVTSGRQGSDNSPDDYLQDGYYLITNVKHGNRSVLLSAESNSQIYSSLHDPTGVEWYIKRYKSTSKYTIMNKKYQKYAGIALRPTGLDSVVAIDEIRQWRIDRNGLEPGHFVIAALRDNVYWGVIEREALTPVDLRPGKNDTQNHWRFIAVPDSNA